MTTGVVSLAELRSQVRTNRDASHDGGDHRLGRDASILPSGEAVVRVVGVSGGVGTSTVALGVAEALEATRLVELCGTRASGLAGASVTELGLRDGWSLGRRGNLRLERRLVHTAPMLPNTQGELTVVDAGVLDESSSSAGPGALVLVAACSVPSIRRLDAHLQELPSEDWIAVITCVPGRGLPPAVRGVLGAQLRAAAAAPRLLLFPECPRFRIEGLGPAPLSRRLREAAAPIAALLKETS